MARNHSAKPQKQYPHFDKLIPASELEALLANPDKIAQNPFFPFIRYTKQYRQFRERGEPVKLKERPIRYASRRDAAIYAHYRSVLSQHYEFKLQQEGLDTAVIAYRHIPCAGQQFRGKCNIDFAHDVFEEIVSLGNCIAMTLDISSFFESLDHSRLYSVWCDLLGVRPLPRDHLAVFKAITEYTSVDRDALYERLGYAFTEGLPGGSIRRRYKIPFRSMPKQLCSPREFREMVLGEGAGYTRLVSRKNRNVGIPQGAPLSDLLANAYMLEFDRELSGFAAQRGGKYWRYSDDIILVIPGDCTLVPEVKAYTEAEIQRHGSALRIKTSKTAVVEFRQPNSGTLEFSHVDGASSQNGLEYLGFRFDGKLVYVRDSTVSRFFRKVKKRARRQARKDVARFHGKPESWFEERFSLAEFEKRFGRVQDFESLVTAKGWTFWTYARRSEAAFGYRGSKILGQVRSFRRHIRELYLSEIRLALRDGD